MAGKKAKSEIESIRTELNALTEAIYALREHVALESAATAASREPDTAAHASRSGGRAAVAIAGSDETGEVSGSGYLRLASSADEPLAYQWASDHTPVRRILDQEADSLARLLAAIGHRQRLAILKAILAKPSSAADLVASLQLGTTGAAYHHLNVLQAAELVTQEDRGIFAIHPQKVGTLLAILASTFAVTTIGAIGAIADGDTPLVDAPVAKRKAKKKSGAESGAKQV